MSSAAGHTGFPVDIACISSGVMYGAGVGMAGCEAITGWIDSVEAGGTPHPRHAYAPSMAPAAAPPGWLAPPCAAWPAAASSA